MRRSSELTRSTAVVLLLALATGCATPRTAPTVPATQIPVPAPGPRTVTVTTPEQPPSLPPVSLGPRSELGIARPAPPPLPPQHAVPSTAPPVPASARGKFVVLNFDNADIETVIHAASEIVGFNYVLAPDVKGKVTVQTSGRIPQENVFGVLLAVLEVYGFTAVKSDNLYKIVRIEGARERAVPTIVGAQPDPNRTTDEVITQIVPLRYANVNDLSTLLRPLMSPRGTLIAHRETNVLILTDLASNVRRLLDIVRLVDVEVALDTLDIIPVSYADANTLAAILSQLFSSGRLRPSVAAPPGVPSLPAAPLPTPLPGQPVPTVPGGPAGTTTGIERRPLILPEPRSNSLVVYGSRAEVDSIRRLVGQLDINIYGGRRVFIYYAENAKAKDLVATLNAIYGAKDTTSVQPTPGLPGPGGLTPPRPYEPVPPPPTAAPGAPLSPGTAAVGLAEGQIRFIADETTNAVIVQTTPKNWPQLEATIKQLDKMPRQVLIEVLVAEVTLTDDTRLGMDWAIKQGRFAFAQTASNSATRTTIPTSPTGTGTMTAPSNAIPHPGTAAALGPIAAGLTAFTFSTDQFFAILNTLAEQDKVNVLSNPHVMTSENKKAIINVSQSVPIVTTQQVPIGGTAVPTATNTTSVIGTQSVQYIDAGVILTVTPRIGERGTVALDVKQEVNDVGAPVPPTGSPSIVKREAETSVVLLDQQTLVLGGLITDRREMVSRGIPLLKDIPILGFLFGFKERVNDKRELLLLITPRVVGTALDAAGITEQMRRGTPELDATFERARRPPVTPPAVAPPTPPGVPPSPPAPPR